MISIIMPTYNRAYIIERAIQSVIKQTYEDWELIIVDDASSDDTKIVVEKYVGPKIRYYNNEVNKGANASRNIGARYASGEFLTFLDSDNYWPNYKLEEQLTVWENLSSKRCFLYGQVQIKDGEKVRVVPGKRMDNAELIKQELHENCIDTNSIFIPTSLFVEVGGFDEMMPRLQDWELVLRLLCVHGVDAIYCDKVLSYNVMQPNSIGRNPFSYNKAYILLFRKYFCKYLTDSEIIECLCRILKDVPDDLCLLNEIIGGTGRDTSSLLIESIRRVLNAECTCGNVQITTDLLHMWHRKNIECESNTIFSKYFYCGSNINSIAIYGLGKIGELFYDEIKQLPVDIKYGIDKKVDAFRDIPVFKLGDELETVDWVVVAVSTGEEQIKDSLLQLGINNVVTVRELVDGA